jgi:ATP-dependent RNA helicase DeaD
VDPVKDVPERDDREASAVARSQNALHILPHDVTLAGIVLGAHLERLDRASTDVQMVIVAPDPDDAIALARVIAPVAAATALRVIPASSARRAARLLRGRATHVVIGAAPELLELVRTSTLKLENVRALILAWADEIIDDAASRDALESVLAEVPKEAARTVIASRQTPDVEQVVERYARRARRVAAVDSSPTATPIRYVTSAAGNRVDVLQRTIDELDPVVAAVFTRSDRTARDLRDLLESLGYAGDDEGVRVTRGAPVIEADTLILLDLPTPEELSTLLGGATPAVVAIVQPRQVVALRALAGGAPVTPLGGARPAAQARARVASVRAELRDLLAAGVPAHEMLALEPLLEEYDGAEIAAAALRLLEREREAARQRQTAAAAATTSAASPAAWTRVFVGAGARDRITAGDLVGAIANTAGISREQIGRIELRDTHALVDIASAEAEKVVGALSGTSIKGRRAVARIDRGREGGARAPRGGRDDRGRGARGRDDRGSRGPRPRRDIERRRPPTDVE